MSTTTVTGTVDRGAGYRAPLLGDPVVERGEPVHGLAEHAAELPPPRLADLLLENPLDLEEVDRHSVVRGEHLCAEDRQPARATEPAIHDSNPGRSDATTSSSCVPASASHAVVRTSVAPTSGAMVG